MTRDFDAVFFDLDGVLVTGGKPLPGALGTLHAMLDAHIPFLILSNMTLWPRVMMLDRFRTLGLDLTLDRMLTPPAAAARWLRQKNDPPTIILVAPPTRVEFEGLNLLPSDAERGAEYVVLGDLGELWTPQIMDRALGLLLGGAQLVALGMGRYWMSPEGLKLDVGAYASALAYATGQTPIVMGKPSREFFQMALNTLNVAAERVLMVGDDVQSDVGAAQQVGMKAVLVQTGKFRPSDLERGITPDWTLPDVSHVLALLGRSDKSN